MGEIINAGTLLIGVLAGFIGHRILCAWEWNKVATHTDRELAWRISAMIDRHSGPKVADITGEEFWLLDEIKVRLARGLVPQEGGDHADGN